MGWAKWGEALRGGRVAHLLSRAGALFRDRTIVRIASSAGAALTVGMLLWSFAFVLAFQLLFPMPAPCKGDKPCVLVMGLDGEDFTAPQTWYIRDLLKAARVEVKIVPRMLVRHIWDDAPTARRRVKVLALQRLAELRGDVLITGTVIAKDVRLTIFAGDRQETITVPQDFNASIGTELSAIVCALAGPKAEAALQAAAKRVAALAVPSRRVERGLLFQSYAVSLAARGSTEQAIWAFREALKERPRQAVPQDWAQSALDLARLLVGDRLTEAVALYGEITSDPSLPLDWGDVRQDYGLALLSLGERENDIQKMARAATQFWVAIQERPKETMPLAWAASQKAFADAQAAAGIREPGTQRLTMAVNAYRAALEVPGQPAHARAVTMAMMGDALACLGEREPGSRHLAEAASLYRSALADLDPVERAAALNSLGTVLRTDGDPARWEEAISAYRKALTIWTRASAPLDWAMAQNNLGVTLARLGQRDSGPERLQEAVAAYRAALLERTREREPQLWATTENNLGSALKSLGERTGSERTLEEAIVACREALKERTRERGLLPWAITQNNLGNALMSLGKQRYSLPRLQAAVAAYRDALEALSPESGAYYDIASENLHLAEALLYQRRKGLTLQ